MKRKIKRPKLEHISHKSYDQLSPSNHFSHFHLVQTPATQQAKEYLQKQSSHFEKETSPKLLHKRPHVSADEGWEESNHFFIDKSFRGESISNENTPEKKMNSKNLDQFSKNKSEKKNQKANEHKSQCIIQKRIKTQFIAKQKNVSSSFMQNSHESKRQSLFLMKKSDFIKSNKLSLFRVFRNKEKEYPNKKIKQATFNFTFSETNDKKIKKKNEKNYYEKQKSILYVSKDKNQKKFEKSFFPAGGGGALNLLIRGKKKNSYTLAKLDKKKSRKLLLDQGKYDHGGETMFKSHFQSLKRRLKYDYEQKCENFQHFPIRVTKL